MHSWPPRLTGDCPCSRATSGWTRCGTTAGAVVGLTVLDDDGRAGVLRAPAVLLATGGYGQVFGNTTNAATATGDGVALALRAGATAADLEFVQFHPTALHVPDVAGMRPLVTEAVRGEGAVLRDCTGLPFMTGVHPLADLAPRDVVAATITRRLAETGAECVWLDATTIPRFATRFPTVHAACAAIGIDPAKEPIPVTPAAHYTCGGITTDEHGRTGVAGLYAAGEVARTGLHGANRLASNSLLEGLVVGGRAARAVAADLATPRCARSASRIPPPPVGITDRGLVQSVMSRHAGIGRDEIGLTAAAHALATAVRAGEPSVESRRGVEDAALTLVARSVLTAARARHELVAAMSEPTSPNSTTSVRSEHADPSRSRRSSRCCVTCGRRGTPRRNGGGLPRSAAFEPGAPRRDEFRPAPGLPA